MHQPLTWVLDRNAESKHTLARLEGSITEHTDLGGLSAALHDDKPITLDLGKIVSINSVGVRQWLDFITTLTKRLDVQIVRCAVPLVAQMNMVAGFRGEATVGSVMIPLLCASCGREDTVELSVTMGVNPTIPQTPCAACESTMEFDDLEESYFRFLLR